MFLYNRLLLITTIIITHIITEYFTYGFFIRRRLILFSAKTAFEKIAGEIGFTPATYTMYTFAFSPLLITPIGTLLTSNELFFGIKSPSSL